MELIIWIILAIYTFFTSILMYGWLNIKSYPFKNTKANDHPTFSNTLKHKPFISVIIVVRNEADNILQLLEDLDKQTLKGDSFEVIVMDDFSEDDTYSIIEEFSKKSKFPLSVFSLQNKENLSPKKAAISQAISMAKGELIVTTDGDCRVSENWLACISAFYKETGAFFISGIVTFYDEKTFFEKIQTIEFASLVASGASTLNLGMPTMCNGANMAYPKKIFEEVNGYELVGQIASGDDEFLYHKIAKKHPAKVFFLKSRETIVYTKAKKTLSEFYYQRKRWGSKWKYYKDNIIKTLALFIFVVNFRLLTAFFLALSGYYSFIILIMQAALKFTFECVFLALVLCFFGKKNFIYLIFPLQLIYALYVVFFGMIVNFRKDYLWKGRRLK